MSEYTKQGGTWLAAVRSWIQCNCTNGSKVTWGSNDVLSPNITVKQIEEIAARAVDVSFPEFDLLKKSNYELKMCLFASTGTSSMRTNFTEILDKCGYDNWDNDGAKAISLTTTLVAMEFLTRLREHLQSPKIIPQPSGVIGLEWEDHTNGQSFSVGISGTRTIKFAGSYSDGTLHGSEQLGANGLPLSVVAGLDRLFSKNEEV